MNREYEIFECLSDGTVRWRLRTSGLQNARLELHRLTQDTGKEHFALNLSTREVVFPVDESRVKPERAAKRIFQIAYDERMYLARAELLRSLGYPVISAVGNEAARALLTTLHRDDLGIALFIVGHGAPLETRQEMVAWLKMNYPQVKNLVLNPPNQRVPSADYNVVQNGPEAWLPLVTKTMSSMQAS